jgi:ribosomal-protein-alanine N-acetyltransferase
MNPVVQKFRIRPMTVADLDRVIEIAQSLKQAPQWPRMVYEAAVGGETTPKRIALVAQDASTGTVAGLAVASVTPPEAELETIVVATAFQRLGVARRLITALAAELLERGTSELLLEVRVSNRSAQTLYGSLGFLEAGWRPGYYAEPIEDALVMRLKLI